MLLCHDGSLYTGITTNLERRVREHNAGTGAKYTRMNGPVRVVYLEAAASRSEALRRERAIKSLPRARKAELLVSPQNSLQLYAQSPRIQDS